jgi:uncharacterized protein YcbX
MASTQAEALGKVAAIWRYPLKSMAGEELTATEVSDRGHLGDRAYALVDVETGLVVSAKNPRRWPGLLDCQATFLHSPTDPRHLPAVRVTFPDGPAVTTDQADFDGRLSTALGRPIRLARSAMEGARAEGYWPDHEWLEARDRVFQFSLPPGTFFDGAAVHLLTTATLGRLRTSSPASDFDLRRFRPNFLIQTDASTNFIENDWIGRTLTLGAVQLRVDGPCPRCVMTTLTQGGLPRDIAALRTAVQQNGGNVGVYATVIRGGRVRQGDSLAVT